LNYLYGLFKNPLPSNNNPFLVIRLLKQALQPLMPQMRKEKPSVYEKLNLLEIENVDKLREGSFYVMGH
jgi:hypothetical protein